MDAFLCKIDLSKLNKEPITALESPISMEELHAALKHMPGPDGFPSEFYKGSWPELTPVLYIMLMEIKETSILPPNMNGVNLSLHFKPGKKRP